MATYKLTQPAFVSGRHYEADPRNPLVVELPKDVEPSTAWEPMDGEAKSILEKLDKDKLETVKQAREAALKGNALAPLPKLPKREVPKETETSSALEGATPDTHLRPAPPTVPGTDEQRPQDLGPKESQAHPTSKQVKRASDKDTL